MFLINTSLTASKICNNIFLDKTTKIFLNSKSKVLQQFPGSLLITSYHIYLR